MKVHIFWGDLTDISAKKEALAATLLTWKGAASSSLECIAADWSWESG